MSAIAGYGRVLRNPALSRLLAGEFISSIGDWLYLVALLVIVYAETQSGVLLGIVGAARVVPFIVLSVPAGVVADRFDRPVILLVTDLARGALQVVLAALVLFDGPVLAVVALAILAACFSTFFGPAIAALIPSLVTDETELGPANGAWATLDNVAFIIGPAVAGLLIAGGGVTFAFLLNAVSFGIVAAVLWRLPSPPGRAAAQPDAELPPRTPEARPIGWQGVVRPLAAPLVLDAATSFVGGGLGVLTVVLATEVLVAGEEATGYLNAATGVGGVVAGAISGVLLLRSLRMPLLAGAAVGGIGLVALASTTSLAIALLAMGVAVGALLLLDIVNTTLVQRSIPDELRGRASGIIQTSGSLSYALGSLVLPILATATGVTPVLVGSGLAVAGAAVVAVLLFPSEAAGVTALDPARERALRLPIFAGLPLPRVDAAARRLVHVPVRAGETIVRQGELADRFYIITSGSFAVTEDPPDGESRLLRRLGPDEVFGEIGLLTGRPRTATVTAETDGELLALDRDEFLELVGSGPGLAPKMLDLYRGAVAPA